MRVRKLVKAVLPGLLLAALAPLTLSVLAQPLVQPFLVSDIRVEGLQRISAGTVFSAMPIAVGDTADADLPLR